MKKHFLMLGLAASIIWSACGENSTDETVVSDSTTNNATTMSSGDAPVADMPTVAVNPSFNMEGKYVDLKTNKPLRFKKDTADQYLLNYETNEPFDYYFYSPASRDTFDRFGNVVNSYLLKDASGVYIIDEKRWKVKQDSDGDIKIKDGKDAKIKYDASSGETKIKDGDTTIKP